MRIRPQTAIALLMLCALSCPASAQQIHANSRCCGPVTLNIGADGAVNGFYPRQGGVLEGTMGADGVVTGIWTQPRSDYPCMSQHNGREAWGHFVIYDIGAPTMSGAWGYCDARPSRPFGFQ